MRIKGLLTFCALALIVNASLAQSLTPFVISSSGGFYSNSSGQLSFTTAEMSMVTTLSNGSNMLTQGFQQPFDVDVAIMPIENTFSSFGVYPNPGNGNFNVTIDSRSLAKAKALVYDVLGQEVFKKEINLVTGKQVVFLNLTELSEGIYILKLISSDYKNSIHSLQKIQITK